MQMEKNANFQCTEITTANSNNILNIQCIYDIFKHNSLYIKQQVWQCVNNMLCDVYSVANLFIQ